MEKLFLLIPLILLCLIIFVIILRSSIKRKNKRGEIEDCLNKGWKAIAEKNIVKAREYYEQIRTIYRSDNDPKNKLKTRINLFYNKLSEKI